jgi:hypothetical protein
MQVRLHKADGGSGGGGGGVASLLVCSSSDDAAAPADQGLVNAALPSRMVRFGPFLSFCIFRIAILQHSHTITPLRSPRPTTTTASARVTRTNKGRH